MVWFVCDGCGDSFKKPKLQSHFGCGHSFTCVDCCVTFDRDGAKGHSQCVTEHEKYALGATKPGGFAANGLPGNREQPQTKGQDAEPSGLEFLSTRPPWRCSVCNVNCTSKDTLMSHAAGVKHKRRARAASAAANGGQQQPQNAAPSQSEPSETPAQQTPEPTQPTAPASNDQDGSNKKRPAKDSDSDSSSSSDSDSDSDAADKKKQKKGKADGSHPALSDASALAAFIKASKKKIAKKGKLGGKLLQKLAAKKLGSKEADEQLLKALREKLVESGVGQMKGKFLVASS